MIEARRYCPEILVQTRAAASALKRVELSIMEQHLRSCVAHAAESRNGAKVSEKIEEIMEILENFR